eukprot:9314204-Prorocentrum_lima.AAC.1
MHVDSSVVHGTAARCSAAVRWPSEAARECAKAWKTRGGGSSPPWEHGRAQTNLSLGCGSPSRKT